MNGEPARVRILAISGSLQAGSSNVALLQTARAAAPAGVDISIFDGLRDLPQFDLDLEASGPLPVVEQWRKAIAASDALLIASPEYGFSLPGSLKNAIDWVIGSGELEGKLVAITCSVNHPDRGRRGLAALAGTLSAVKASVVGNEPLVRGPTFASALDKLLTELIERARAQSR